MMTVSPFIKRSLEEDMSTYFGFGFEEVDVFVFLEQNGYTWDIIDNVWLMDLGKKISRKEEDCFRYLMACCDYGPPVTYKHQPRKKFFGNDENAQVFS